MSAAMKFMPSRPRRMVRSSRVDQPPVSGVPVAGATVGLGWLVGWWVGGRTLGGGGWVTRWVKGKEVGG